MATNPYVNKVKYGNDTIIDLTSDTADIEDVRYGKLFHKKTGQQKQGRAYMEVDNQVIVRADVLEIFPSTSEDVPAFLLGGVQISLRVDSNNRYCYLVGLNNAGTESQVTLQDCGAGYGDSVTIRQLFFVDLYTVLIAYTYSNSTSGGLVYTWMTRDLHRKIDGTLISNNSTSIKAMYAANYLKRFYYDPSFFTDLNNNSLMRFQQDIGNGTNNNTLYITQYTETRNIQQSSVDAYNNYSWTAAGSDGSGSYNNKFSYPGNNLKARGGICWVNMQYSKPYITLRLRGEEVTYPWRNSVDTYVSDATNRSKLEVILPGREYRRRPVTYNGISVSSRWYIGSAER